MELLSRRRRGAWAFGVLFLGLAVGCALLRAPEADALAFSHAVHVREQGLECINCHEDVSVSDTPGMPAQETCDTCHSLLDEGKPAERRIGVLFTDERFRAARVSALADELVFSHLRHAETVEDCGACHRGIEANRRVGTDLALAMDDCTTCHAERDVANECATCHTQVGQDWAPPSHHHAWKERHGAAVRGHSRLTADSCTLCHQESTCTQCHAIELPRSHTNAWRLRTHGVMARMDRDGCATCHRSDACDACHAETRPLSHTGSFGAPRSRHCFGCHFPLRNEGCVTCHASTPSHSMAKPKPDWHTPAMNCRQCHGSLQPLPHADKGDDCNLCHM